MSAVKDNEGKKLYRSKVNRMVAGVCGGLGDYLNLDSVLLRIIWVVLTLFGGIGVIVYIAGIIIIPENPNETHPEKEKTEKNDRTIFWGSALIIVGIVILLKQFGFFYYFSYWHIPWQIIWSVFLILLGVFLLYNKNFSITKDMTDGKSEIKNENNEEKKQLYRSRTVKMISGVCGGLADYFNIDVSLVRIGWVLLSLASFGIGILGYIVMIIVFQEEPEDISTDVTPQKTGE